MADEADALIDLATAISDGAPVDWPSVQSSNISEADRAVLQHLRVIAEIVSLQQRLASQPVHTSVVDEMREETRAAGSRRADSPTSSRSTGSNTIAAPSPGTASDTDRAASSCCCRSFDTDWRSTSGDTATSVTCGVISYLLRPRRRWCALGWLKKQPQR